VQTLNTSGGTHAEPGQGQEKPHAVIIGSGFGGLAAAIRLGARGYRVTVLERRDQPGGRAYVYRQNGFVFDGGPTVITAPFLLEELWELCGKRMSDTIDMRPVTPFYRVRFHDGELFDYQGDAEVMREQIRKFNPDDVEGYERFLRMSEQIFELGFEKLSHVPFGRMLDMLKITPAMIRLQSYRTVYSLVARFIRDDRLRQVFSFHPLLVGGNPFKTTSIYTLIAFLERKWGVYFPAGGTGSLVSGLVELIEGQGSSVRLGVEVDEILVEGNRACGVQLKGGERIDADIVVSNADSAFLYSRLLPAKYRRRWTDKKLERLRYSMSLFVWYFGTKRKYEDVAHHTILLGPRYQGLLDDIFERKVLADDFSLYLHRPTATDPSLAPDGCDTFYVLSPVPHLDSDTDWNVERERYRAKICKYLSDTIMPGLEDQLAASHILDPIGFRDELLAHKGAAFGVEPVLQQSAYWRPHNKSEEIDGLYLVGAGTHPGAGVPGVLSSAKVLDKVVPDAAALRAQWAGR
jgi:phytoene desaturase